MAIIGLSLVSRPFRAAQACRRTGFPESTGHKAIQAKPRPRLRKVTEDREAGISPCLLQLRPDRVVAFFVVLFGDGFDRYGEGVADFHTGMGLVQELPFGRTSLTTVVCSR